MQSPLPALAQWQLTVGDDPARDIAWLVATGCDAVVTHGPKSREIFHQLRPAKFAGRLPAIYDRLGDVIYRVPRRFPGLARVVSEARMESLPAIPWSNANGAQLAAYAAAAEDSARQVDYQRTDVAEMRLRAVTVAGESILVQETWDSGWHAYDHGAAIAIRRDVMSFMRLQTSAGDHDIRLVYQWPIESRIGQWVTLASLFALMYICVHSRSFAAKVLSFNLANTFTKRLAANKRK
jgi:hypothetical protein